MSQNQINDVNYDNVNSSNDSPKSKKKSKNINFLIYLVCLLLAFIFWCYALYIDDPVIQATVTVHFELVNGDSDDFLMTTSKTMTVYAKRSYLENKTHITATVDRSQFKEYNQNTLVKIKFDKLVECETKEVYLKLATLAK